jgi:hypothetical protein
MTTREISAQHLEELATSLYRASDQQRFLDAIGFAVAELRGEDPFGDTKNKWNEKDCPGECDHTYEIQREFEDAIGSAIEELEEVQGKTKEDCEKIKHVIRDLNMAI